jgi:cytochrome P450
MLQRRAAPTADLISRLANEGDVNSRLSDDEIIVLCNFLLTLGHEITFNLLAGSVCHLLSERHLWDQLLEHPKILANATEELLRFISPILWIPRKMTKDTELDGHILRKGSRVYLGIGAANHDPSQFTNPDTLDLTRSKPHSLAFGYGSHFSVGLAFAKLETKLALSSLLHNMPDITLGSRVFDYRPIHFLRALKTLQVSGKVG